MDSNTQLIYSTIRETVSAIDVGKALGLNINQHGRCQCPFHNGHDDNMKLYPGNRGYYCFVCHAGGDCISLAKQLLDNGTSYNEAARWIDSTFGLNLFSNVRPTFRQRIHSANRRRGAHA